MKYVIVSRRLPPHGEPNHRGSLGGPARWLARPPALDIFPGIYSWIFNRDDAVELEDWEAAMIMLSMVMSPHYQITIEPASKE